MHIDKCLLWDTIMFIKPSFLYEIEVYVDSEGISPFLEWLESIDKVYRYRIKERLDRLALGNPGDWKSISNGVSELRFTFGSGYRVYFGRVNKKIILLTNAGDKRTQKSDIKKAITYLKDYLSEMKYV